jgi:hypothetical protein
MSKVISLSKTYPAYHSKAGQLTLFAEKFLCSFPPDKMEELIDKYKGTLNLEDLYSHIENPKRHTIRSGHRWKEGDMFSPRQWGTDVNPKSGRSGPYHSKQIILADDQKLHRVHEITILCESVSDKHILIDGKWACNWGSFNAKRLAENDGLSHDDLKEWFTKSPEFKKEKIFTGQILIWHPTLQYPLI